MFNNIFIKRFAFLLILLIISCTPGDEDPPETNPLTSLLGINTLNGYFWEGGAVISSCNYVPSLTETLANCYMLEEAQAKVAADFPKNMNLNLVLNNNSIEGELFIALPHFNLLPASYIFSVSGTSEPSSDNGLVNLFLSQTAVVQSLGEPDYNANFIGELSAVQLPETLSGSLKLNLARTGYNDAAEVDYAFELAKIY